MSRNSTGLTGQKEIESGLARAMVVLLLALMLPFLASAHPPDDDHTHHEAGAQEASLAETGAS